MKKKIRPLIFLAVAVCVMFSLTSVSAFAFWRKSTPEPAPTEEPVASVTEAEAAEEAAAVEAEPEAAAEEEAEAPVVPEPVTTPEPDTVPATVRKDDTHAIVGRFHRGDVVDIVDEIKDNYYTVMDSLGQFYYVDKRFVRTDEPVFGEEKPMYVDSGAALYETAYLDEIDGEPLTTLEKNSVVVQIDELNGIAYCYYQPDDTNEAPVYGYVSADKLSEEKFSTWMPSYYYSGSSGGSDDSWSGGGGGGGGSSYADGEDIFLAYQPDVVKPVIAQMISYQIDSENFEITGKEGTIFSDGIEIIATIYNKGESVAFIEKNNDDYWTILYEHKICEIPPQSVLIDGEEEPWEETDGYIGVDQTKIYDNPEMEGDPILKVVIRAKVRGLELDGEALYIEVTDSSIPGTGTKGYIPLENFTTERPGWGGGGYYYDGGSSDGGDYSGGGGGGSSAPASTPEWSGDYF